MKIMEVFLPLPQWRREELLHVYCNKVLRIYNMDLETCFEKTFADYQSLRSIRKFLLKKLINDKNEEMAKIIYYILKKGIFFDNYT
uniref:Uncharacterized protein n=1 Tax=Meloidogyne enterolobii TaxID=390850 RepID=A0A6V7UH50_MELEN|nr:unnamed protein product [Meloidogyne enterolobii]